MSIDLTHLRELASLADVLRQLHVAAEDVADRSLIIGATARDLILHHAHQLPITRGTVDLDIAVSVRSWDAFRRLERRLRDGGARRDDGTVHRFYVDDYKVDIVPFGGVEQQGMIVWPETEAEMSVAGFEEASSHAIEVILPGEVVTFVAAPSALLILKLLAWDERHLAMPRHDGPDIRTLIESYAAEWNEDRLYNEADELLQKFGYDNDLAAAALIGQDAASIAHRKTLERIREIVGGETSNDALALARDMGRSIENNLKLLRAVLTGLESAKT